jgi:alpha-tubulin suppressor-like RCC1 family protein
MKQYQRGLFHAARGVVTAVALTFGKNNPVSIDGNFVAAQRNLPTRTVPELAASSISAGALHNCALTSEMDLYCWGNNLHGALGDRTMQTRYTPTPMVMP